jgi:hypothetical protein
VIAAPARRDVVHSDGARAPGLRDIRVGVRKISQSLTDEEWAYVTRPGPRQGEGANAPSGKIARLFLQWRRF